MTTPWTREHLAALDPSAGQTGVFTARDVVPILPHLYLWDLWPVRNTNGTIANVSDSDLWMALSAPSSIEPGERHDMARIRLISHGRGGWSDHGSLFADGDSPGSREWAGCATHDTETGRLDVIYTAAGRRGEAHPGFEQRIIAASGRILEGGTARFADWTGHREIIRARGAYRDTSGQDQGEPGYIKAFRDPFRFLDPADGRLHVLFTASLRDSATDFDGVIGLASGADLDHLDVFPPLITADGVNNELERPHVVVRDGLYYLFFSTQARTFHPDIEGPTGLYGFFAESLGGPWRPVNASGLILRNPVAEPFQAYSWLVLDDLRVFSFVDFYGLAGREPGDVESAGGSREHFGGTIAPVVRIFLDGDRAGVEKR